MTPDGDLAAAVTAAAAEMRKRSTHTTERVRETIPAEILALLEAQAGMVARMRAELDQVKRDLAEALE